MKHINDKGMELLLKGPVVIEEKLNVFPITFQAEDNTVKVKAPKGLPAEAAEYLKSLDGRLIKGWVYYAGAPFGYPVKPRNGLVLFDVTKGLNNYYVGWSHRDLIADALEMDCPHVLYEGLDPKKPKLFDLLYEESAFGGGKVSGIVIKNYEQFDKDGNVLMGKLEGLCS